MTTPDNQGADAFRVTLPPFPYPGLRPFNGDEWPIFFGRERMADEVVARLVREQFLVVHGDSGCGKSSLIRAGVLPRLEQENARGGLTWRTATTQPRNAPLQLFAEALAALDGRSGDDGRIIEIRRMLNFGAEAPRALSALLRRGPADHICVLVDQFEELFAFARHSNGVDARLFVEILVALLDQPQPGLYAVVTMRSEFLGACAHFPGLAEAVNRAQYLLPRMAHADLTRAVREPAGIYGGEISAALAERLIEDSGGSQDQLPLIQHGLMQLTRAKATLDDAQRNAGAEGPAQWRVGLDDYQRVGDLSESLSNHADAILASVETAPFHIAERMFRALTDINADGQAVRRPQTVAQLAEVCGTDLATILRIAAPFRAEGASLLTPFGAAAIAGQTLIDISHEALIRCWSRIAAPSGWLAGEFQDGLRWRALLVQADDFANDREHLLALATADDHERWLASRSPAWAERYGGGWDKVQRLVQASLASGRAQVREKEAAARRRRRYAGAFAVFLVLVAIGLAWLTRRANQALARANEASATSLWNRLDFANADRLQDDELNALWEVRRADAAVKAVFFDQLTTVRDRVMRLSRRPVPVLHAISLQWTPAASAAVRDAVLRETAAASTEPATVIAFAPAVQSMAASMTADQAQALFDLYLQAIRRAAGTTTTPSGLPSPAAAMAALAMRLEAGPAASRLSAVIDALAAPSATDDSTAFGAAGSALAARVAPEQVDAQLTAALDVIAKSSDPNAIVTLTGVAQALAVRASPPDTRLGQVLARLAEKPSAPEQSALATIALALAARIGNTTPAFERAIALGLATTDDQEVWTVVTQLASKAADPEALRVGAPLVDQLARRRPGERSGSLAAVLGQLLPRMPAADRTRALAALIHALALSRNATDSNILASVIGTELQRPDAVSADQIRQTVAALIAAAHYGNDEISLEGFQLAANRAAGQLSPAEARASLAAVLAQMADSVAPGKLRALSTLIPPLTGRLTTEDAAALLPQTWQLMTKTTDTNQIAGYSLLVPNAARQITPAIAQRSLVPCIDFLVHTDDPDQIGALAVAAQYLVALLPDNQRPPSLAPALGPLEKADPDRLARLSPIVPALAPALTPAQADALFPRLVDAMATTIYATHLVPLQLAAAAIVPRMSAEYIAPAAIVVAKAWSAARDPDRIVSLTASAEALGSRLDTRQQEPLLQTLTAWAPSDAHAKAALVRLMSQWSRAPEAGAARAQRVLTVLKYPTVSGDSAVMLVGWLHDIDKDAPGAEPGIPPNLEWIARTYPATDPGEPPACPTPLLPSLSCPASTHSSFFDLNHTR